MVQNEWLWPTSGEFGSQSKVMWNCTICSSYGSVGLYFKNLPLKNDVALLLFFMEGMICLYGANWGRGVNFN